MPKHKAHAVLRIPHTFSRSHSKPFSGTLLRRHLYRPLTSLRRKGFRRWRGDASKLVANIQCFSDNHKIFAFEGIHTLISRSELTDSASSVITVRQSKTVCWIIASADPPTRLT